MTVVLFPLVKSPIIFDFVGSPETAQEEFIKMMNNTVIKSEFTSLSEIPCCISMVMAYLAPSSIVLEFILPFSTTY
jgi:hypothetical protein